MIPSALTILFQLSTYRLTGLKVCLRATTEGTTTAKTAYLCPLSTCGSHSDHCGGGDGGAGYGDVVGEDVSRGNRRRGLRHFEKIPPRNEAGGAHVKVIYMSQKV